MLDKGLKVCLAKPTFQYKAFFKYIFITYKSFESHAKFEFESARRAPQKIFYPHPKFLCFMSRPLCLNCQINKY